MGIGLGDGLGLGLDRFFKKRVLWYSRVRVRVRVEVGMMCFVVTVLGLGLGGGYFLTEHSASYTTVTTEGSPSGRLSGDLCRDRVGPHSNDAGMLAG